MKKKFDFVASGLGSYTKISSSQAKNNEKIKDLVKYFFDLFPSKHHNFSLLFNAYTEKPYSDFYKDNFGNHFNNLYADSGGLQMITRGMNATEEDKRKVYLTQSKASDYGMCFDEIPVKIVSDSSKSRKGSEENTRIFDPDRLEECAKNTGKNIRNQIEVYLDQKTKTKPVMIIQGNCEETYRRWIEYMLSEIPKDYHQYLTCMASGAAALGQGQLEDIQRLVYSTLVKEYLPDMKHIHILGVGSIRRIVPTIIFSHSLLKDYYISYDSTKQSMAANFGWFFQKNGKAMTIKRNLDVKKYTQVKNDINELHDMFGMDLVTFHEAMNTSVTDYTNKYGNAENVIVAFWCYCAKSLYNFIREFDHVYENIQDNNLMKKHCGTDFNSYIALKNVKDLYDYTQWEEFMKSEMKSKKIRDEKEADLGDLFE